MRVVSLVPSVTETLLAWLGDGQLEVVACTRFCEQPQLVHVGGTKDPDLDAIDDLAPDLVVLDREENRREDAEALVARGRAIHVTHVTALGEVGPTLDALRLRLDLPARSLAATPSGPVAPAVSALVPIWRRPWMVIGPGTYGSSLLASLGVRGALDDRGERYPEVEAAEMAARSPELVLLPSEPYPFGPKHVPELQRLLPGVPIVLIDGRDLFWWGIRTPAACRRLGAQLAPWIAT